MHCDLCYDFYLALLSSENLVLSVLKVKMIEQVCVHALKVISRISTDASTSHNVICSPSVTSMEIQYRRVIKSSVKENWWRPTLAVFQCPMSNMGNTIDSICT